MGGKYMVTTIIKVILVFCILVMIGHFVVKTQEKNRK